jgi:hypothetical protein
MVIEIIIFIIFLALFIPQYIHWMNFVAKGYMKRKHKNMLEEYRRNIIKNMVKDDKKKNNEDIDMSGYA